MLNGAYYASYENMQYVRFPSVTLYNRIGIGELVELFCYLAEASSGVKAIAQEVALSPLLFSVMVKGVSLNDTNYYLQMITPC